jgi:O-methyltransferase
MPDNFFLARWFDWNPHPGKFVLLINKVLKRKPLRLRIDKSMDPATEMTTLLQRVNLYHLAMRAADPEIPGDFVELGCFNGKTAVIFAKALQESGVDKALHLYDHFSIPFGEAGSVRDALDQNFASAAVPAPVVHDGDFQKTIPDQLPERISFVHIDCGFGGDPAPHAATVQRCLEAIYPRLSKGAICVLMDYHLPEDPAPDHNPGATLGTDRFLKDKPETITALYAGEASHAFFVKQ